MLEKSIRVEIYLLPTLGSKSGGIKWGELGVGDPNREVSAIYMLFPPQHKFFPNNWSGIYGSSKKTSYDQPMYQEEKLSSPRTISLTLPIWGNPRLFPWDTYKCFVYLYFEGEDAWAYGRVDIPLVIRNDLPQFIVKAKQERTIGLVIAGVQPREEPSVSVPIMGTLTRPAARPVVIEFSRPLYYKLLPVVLFGPLFVIGFLLLFHQFTQALELILAVFLSLWGIRQIIVQDFVSTVTYVDAIILSLYFLLFLALVKHVLFQRAVRSDGPLS